MMMRFILIIGMILKSAEIEGTLVIFADDNLTTVFVNDFDYTSKYNTTLGYKEQSAIVDIYPGDTLTIKVWSIYGGLYLSTRFVIGSYIIQLTNKYSALWSWDLETPIKIKVLGPTTLVGGDAKPYASFTTIVPFPGECTNYIATALQKEKVSIAINKLFIPLILFTDWYSKFPIIFDEINTNGKLITNSNEEIIINNQYIFESIYYVPIDDETTTNKFKFHFNDYTNNNIQCSIEITYCYETCASCSIGGDITNNNCLTCLPGHDVDKTNCLLVCSGTKWYVKGEKKMCVTNCPLEYPLLIKSTLECVASCPSEYPNLISLIKECVAICHDEFPFIIIGKYECDKYCPLHSPYQINTEMKCVSICPNDYPYKVENQKRCVTSCLQYSFYEIEKKMECVSDCPEDYPYKIEAQKKCVVICPDDFPIVSESTKICKESCSNDLYQYNDTCLTIDELKDIFQIKENESSLGDFEIDLTFEELIKKIDNIAEIIDILNGKLKGEDFVVNIIPPFLNSLSTIDLSECENILRKTYGIPMNEKLQIVIIDVIKERSHISKVHYFVYDQKYHRLDLNYCNELQITVNSFILPNSTIDWAKYQEMMEKGINLCDPTDDFFNDICYPYAENGLDMTLSDRRSILYQNVSLCGANCVFEGINFVTNQSICNCSINTNDSIKELINSSFLNSIPSSNFIIIKCYFRLFEFNNLLFNMAFWIILILFLLFSGSFIHFLSRGKKHLYSELNKYPSSKRLQYDLYGNIHTFNRRRTTRGSLQTTRPRIELLNSQKGTQRSSISSMNSQYQRVRRDSLIEDKSTMNRNSIISTNAQDTQIRRDSLIGEKGTKKQRNSVIGTNPQVMQGRRYSLIGEKEIKQRRNSLMSLNSQNHQVRRNSLISRITNEEEERPIENKNSIVSMNSQYPQVIKESVLLKSISEEIEMGSNENNTQNKEMIKKLENQQSPRKLLMEHQQLVNTSIITNTIPSIPEDVDYNCPYTLALKNDKRNVLGMYWQLLKCNYMFFEPFFQQSSFDLASIKLIVLLLTLITEITINAFFFTDDIVSEKYNKAGQLFLFSSLLKSIYSSILNSICINFLVKLAEYQLLLERIGKEYQVQDSYLYLVKKAIKTIKFKITCFFTCGFILIMFCWYYCSLFCIIYHGNQISLFTDEAVSLLISSAFSFGVTLAISILRYSSLRFECKNMYYTAIYFNRFF